MTDMQHLAEHPNRSDILAVREQLAKVRDNDCAILAFTWANSDAGRSGRAKALGLDSPLVVELLDWLGKASELVTNADQYRQIYARRAAADALVACYGRPILTDEEYSALIRPWRLVFPFCLT